MALADITSPTYLRLGYDCRPPGTTVPVYAPWRQVLDGARGALAALGPLVGEAWRALQDLSTSARPALWAVTEFTAESVPEAFWAQADGGDLFVVEEHVAAGGLGMHLGLAMVQRGLRAAQFVHRHACGYPTGRFGSQSFHRALCGLDASGIRVMVAGG